MLYNSDGLPVIFMVYQKGYIFKCDCWYILPVFPILHTFKTKIKIEKICKKKKKKKSVLLRKKNKIWFSKSIFPKGIWKKGCSLIFRSIRY